MIRMQKQKEEAKKEAERVSAMEVAEAGGQCDEQESKGQEGGLSLLGIGGKQIRTGAAKKAGKKRTPGEIRIQKGILT